MSDACNTERDAAAKNFMIHLFNEAFCPEAKVAPEQRGEIVAGHFLQWLAAHLAVHGYDEFAATTDRETYDFVTELAHSDPNRIASVWWQICLNGRTAAHRIDTVSWTLTVRFADGTIRPIMVHAPLDSLRPPLDDGELIGLLFEQLPVFITTLVRDGVDGTHQRGRNLGGEETFNILIDAFLQIIPQLRPELHENLKAYAKLCVDLLYPDIRERAAKLEAEGKDITKPPFPLI